MTTNATQTDPPKPIGALDRVYRAVHRRLPRRLDVDPAAEPTLVWGADEASDRVVRLLRELGRPPLGLVDPQASVGTVSLRDGVSVWSPRQAARAMRATRADPSERVVWIAGPERNPAAPAQTAAALEARIDQAQAASPLRHVPLRYAAGLDAATPFQPGRLLINGFPGSGNMLLQRVLEPLRAMADTPSLPDAEHLLGQFAWEACDAVTAPIDVAVQDHTSAMAPSSLAITTHYGSRYHAFGHASPGAEAPDAPGAAIDAMVFGLTIPTSLWSPTHSTHEPLTPAVFDYYQQRGYRIALIVRHPLDVIVSNAGKLTTGPDGRDPLCLLDTPGWLESMLAPLTAYYRQYADVRDRVALFRYEQALQCPGVFIRQAGELLGVEVSDATAERIWSEIDGKPFSHAEQGHYWRPSIGKHAEFMQARHIDAIRRSGLPQVAETLGYPFDFEAIARDTDPAGRVRRYASAARFALDDARYRGVMGKPLVLSHPDVLRREDDRYALTCTRPEAFDALVRVLDGPPLARWRRLLPDPPGVQPAVHRLLANPE
ncbi:MAG: hypothetical protein AAF288_00100 [Planctomycetota bacterium]